MKPVQINCPHCGAPLKVEATMQQATCEYCGMTTWLDHGTESTNDFDSEEAGYNFEKGRQRAQAEIARQTYSQPRQTYTPVQSKKRHTFWWNMGWIFIFPIPATILIVRSKKMHWILKIVLVLAVWGLYLAIGMAGGKGN